MNRSQVCLQTTIRQFLMTCLPQESRTLLLAVSGGMDSMALMHAASSALLAETERGSESQAAVRFLVAHVDHGLRSREAAAADRACVAALADTLGMALHCREVIPGSIRATSRGSVEESARRLRYRLLLEIAEDCHADAVVTAHHRDDQAETVLHNVLRGTGLRGLQGMRPVRPLARHVLLLRPLLQISRSQIEQYVARHGIPFCNDDTNLDLTITRNRIRHDLLPALQAGSTRDVSQSLANLAEQAAEAIADFDQQADLLLRQTQLELTAEVCRLKRPELCDCNEPLMRHLMTVIWSRLDWPRQSMSHRHWLRLSEAIRAEADQTIAFDLPGWIHVVVQRDLVRMTRRRSVDFSVAEERV